MTGRLTRLLWVLASNSIAAYFAIYGSSDVRRLQYLITQQPFRPTWQDLLRGLIPVAGILLEIFGLKIAKYVNIGYFLVLTVFWGTICIYNWQDMHARFYSVAFCFFALIVVIVDLRIYRNKRVAETAVSVP